MQCGLAVESSLTIIMEKCVAFIFHYNYFCALFTPKHENHLVVSTPLLIEEISLKVIFVDSIFSSYYLVDLFVQYYMNCC